MTLAQGELSALSWSSEEASREVSGTYVEIDRPRKLVFTWSGSADEPCDDVGDRRTIPRGDETDLALTHERLPTPGNCCRSYQGLGNYLDYLADAAAKDVSL